MEYTIFSLSAIQFKVEKSDSSDFKSMQRRTEIVSRRRASLLNDKSCVNKPIYCRKKNKHVICRLKVGPYSEKSLFSQVAMRSKPVHL